MDIIMDSMKDIMQQTLKIYGSISQAYWRSFEVLIIKHILETEKKVKGPILEIGCGNGHFSSLVFDSIDAAIDINPRAIEKVKRSNHIYKELFCMDASCMTFPDQAFHTIFANCVMEHIPNINEVIKDCYRVLSSNGLLLATVPLIEMNNHLLIRGNWYANLRRHQLQHINLFSLEEWEAIFKYSGFSKIEVYPYLFGQDCYFWDSRDFPICIGRGRFTLGNFISYFWKVIPQRITNVYIEQLAARLSKRATTSDKEYPCAAALLAYK